MDRNQGMWVLLYVSLLNRDPGPYLRIYLIQLLLMFHWRACATGMIHQRHRNERHHYMLRLFKRSKPGWNLLYYKCCGSRQNAAMIGWGQKTEEHSDWLSLYPIIQLIDMAHFSTSELLCLIIDHLSTLPPVYKMTMTTTYSKCNTGTPLIRTAPSTPSRSSCFNTTPGSSTDATLADLASTAPHSEIGILTCGGKWKKVN